MLPFILLNVLLKNTINFLDYIVSTVDEWMNVHGALVEWCWQGETKALRGKPVPVPLHPPQMLLGLTCEWTRACTVTGWWLITWFMALPSVFMWLSLYSEITTHSFIHSFMHPVVCPTTGPHPLPKRVLYRVQSSASAFNFQYPHVSLRSSGSCLRLLLRVLATSILPSLFPPITCFRMQFLCMMWPIQIAFLCFIVCRIFLSSLTPCNTLSFFHMISPAALVHPSPALHFETFEVLSLHCTDKHFSTTQD